MDNNLNKSLAALDAAADELLKKSNTDDADKDDVKPDEVSQDDDVKKCDKPDGDNLKKSDDSDDKPDDSDESSDTDSEEDTNKSLENIQQDIMEDFNQDADIASGTASSEFQAAMVAATAKSLGELQYDIRQNNKNDNQIAEVMIKSFQAVITANNQLRADNDKLTRRLNKLEKSLNKGFEDIMEAIDNLSTQPAHMRKSVSSINVHDKDFNKSVNGNGGVSGFESLTKSQVLTTLTNELYANNPEVRTQDIISYESGAPLREELKALVVSKCK